MNRFASLQRLLDSLMASDYNNVNGSGDVVDLVVRLDRPKKVTDDWGASVQALARNITSSWKQGCVRVVVAESNMGLRQSWLSAWRPSPSTDDRAIILEDDITVSPVWYRWLSGAVSAYHNRSTDIAGISLQRQKLVPNKTAATNAAIPDNNGRPFLYKLVGSIGYAPTPGIWLDFLDFAECALATNLSVATPGLITSDWYDVMDKTGMWTQLFVYFCQVRNLYTLYVFPPNNQALATHWREKGEHSDATMGRDFALVERAVALATSSSSSSSSSPPSSLLLDYPVDLIRLDWDARPVSPPVVVRTLLLSAAVGYELKEFERVVPNIRQHYHGDVALLVWQNAPPEVFALVKGIPDPSHYNARDGWRTFVQRMEKSESCTMAILSRYLSRRCV